MKKILALALALMMSLSFAACGGEDNPEPSGSSGTGDTPPAASPQEQTNAPDLDASTPQEQTNTPDSGTATDDTGDTSGDAASGDSIPVLVAGEWPDNEFTRLVPKPAAGAATASDTDSSYCVIAMNWSIEEAMEYAEQLQNAGYNVDMAIQDMSQAGMYTFVADNEDGVRAKILYLGAEDDNRVIRIEK